MFVGMVLAGSLLLLGLHFFLEPEKEVREQPSSKDSNGLESLLDDRGTIYDRNYKELAVTLDRVSLYANVRDVEVNEAAEKIAPILSTDPGTLRKTIEGEPYRAWLAKNISKEEEVRVSELNLRGVFFHRERVRFYPQMQAAAHLVGHVGKSMGLAGVEFRYNSLLNKYGTSLTDAGAVEVQKSKEGPEGQCLLLTVDLKIQSILEKLVDGLAGKREGAKVAAFLMETETGKIIGSANYPSYDPNFFQEASWDDLDNILAEPVAVPESVRKVLWDASLLQLRDEKYDQVLPWSIHSSGRGLGSQLRLWDRVGLNDPIDIDFIRPADGKRHELNLAAHNFGNSHYYDSVAEVATPLHIATALNSMVMGTKVVPHAIDKITGKDGRIFQLLYERSNDAVGDAAAAEIRRLLEAQSVSGPLSSQTFEAESLSFVTEGKLRKYSRNRVSVTFVPGRDPRLMLFVFAKLPSFSPSPAKTKSRFYMTEHVAKIIIPLVARQEVMSNLSDMMTVEEKQEMNFELQREIGKNLPAGSTGREAVQSKMPDLKGFSLRKSLRELKDLGLEIQITGTGVVVEQYPQAGSSVKVGELCRLVLKPH